MSTVPTELEVAQLRESREQIAGLRALADWLEQRPMLPVGVLCWSPSILTRDRDRALEQLARLTAYVDRYDTPTAPYNGDLRVSRGFGGDVSWHVDVKRESVCRPRVVDGKVVWDLPVLPGAAS